MIQERKPRTPGVWAEHQRARTKTALVREVPSLTAHTGLGCVQAKKEAKAHGGFKPLIMEISLD
jgi:hypothetical protein